MCCVMGELPNYNPLCDSSQTSKFTVLKASITWNLNSTKSQQHYGVFAHSVTTSAVQGCTDVQTSDDQPDSQGFSGMFSHTTELDAHF